MTSVKSPRQTQATHPLGDTNCPPPRSGPACCLEQFCHFEALILSPSAVFLQAAKPNPTELNLCVLYLYFYNEFLSISIKSDPALPPIVKIFALARPTEIFFLEAHVAFVLSLLSILDFEIAAIQKSLTSVLCRQGRNHNNLHGKKFPWHALTFFFVEAKQSARWGFGDRIQIYKKKLVTFFSA